MMHFWLIAVVILIPVSVILLTTLHRISRYYPYNFLRPLFLSFLATTVYFFMNFFPMYIRANFPDIYYNFINAPVGNKAFAIWISINQIVIIMGTLFFVRAVRFISFQKIKPWAEWLLMAIICIMMGSKVFVYIFPSVILFQKVFHFFSEYIYQYQNLLPLVLLLMLLRSSGDQNDHKLTRLARPFAFLFIIRDSAVLFYEIILKLIQMNGTHLSFAVTIIGDISFMSLNILLIFLFVRRYLIPALDKTFSEEGLERVMNVLSMRYHLTEREMDVACLILEGKSNKEIGVKLDVSVSTVKNHIYNTYQKLDINSRFELFEKVRQLGI